MILVVQLIPRFATATIVNTHHYQSYEIRKTTLQISLRLVYSVFFSIVYIDIELRQVFFILLNYLIVVIVQEQS
jgi:hypothetical protein